MGELMHFFIEEAVATPDQAQRLYPVLVKRLSELVNSLVYERTQRLPAPCGLEYAVKYDGDYRLITQFNVERGGFVARVDVMAE